MRTGSRSGLVRGGRADHALAAELADQLARIRRRTLALVEPLADDLLARQARDFMSPLAWDLGHIANFEQLWLVDAVEGRSEAKLEDRYDALETPRAERGDLALPSKAEARAGLEVVRADALDLLQGADLASRDPLLRDGYVYRMVMQHEGQHQETMLQALDIPAEDWSAAAGVYGDERLQREGDAEQAHPVDDESRVVVPAGSFLMGTDDRTRAYDNERGRHAVDVDSFEMDRYPVTNRRWLQFVEDGGYGRAALWSAQGRAWQTASGTESPQGWARGDDGWRVGRFGRFGLLRLDEPVQHVSYWEAEAFARWCSGRLPTEHEWEKAAAWGADATAARLYPWGERRPADVVALIDLEAAAERRSWGPTAVGTRPALASRYGVEDMLGSVYQWTCSEFRPYPGFEPFPYAEYSEVFFGDSYRVLRGSSFAAHELLWRNTYRNWDLPHRRQVFSGVRVAYDA
jgi:iron(II)-dependent oxidoreductase